MVSRRMLIVSLLALPLLVGCGRSKFVSMGTAPPGGAFFVVGGAIAEVLNEHKGENQWKVQSKGTKGSQENIVRLQDGELQLALSNAAITYFAVRGEGNWDKPFDSRAVVTMAPNVAMFITKADSGIKTIKDLKGKNVVLGPAGAGFEMFLEPILAAHGLQLSDLNGSNNTQPGAVDLLGDGQADAAFLGGAVPTSAIVQACTSHDIYFIPYDPAAREHLIKTYPFFQAATIKQDAYPDLDGDYQGLNVGSMHLITSASQEEDLIYQLTKTIWENRAEIAAKHPAGRSINEKNAARNTGTEFHPGAVRFYKEIGIWEAAPADEPAETPTAETPAAETPTEETPEKEAAATGTPTDDSPTLEAPATVTPTIGDAPAKEDATPAPSKG